MQTALEAEIKALMERNRRAHEGYQYTVPSPELYPFQWLWDSCFHAIILSHFDAEAAKEELRSVTAKPLHNGLLPHIIYWKEDYERTNWGREMRGDVISASWGVHGTSSLTQPPLVATALWECYTRIGDRGFLHELYPTVRAYYECLLHERDPGSTGLIGIINPDESGEDNSPRFDHALGLSDQHSVHENLNKRIELIQKHAHFEFDAYNCMRDHFWIEDVGFNAILIRGLRSLSSIAREIGEPKDAQTHHTAAERTAEAMRKYLCEAGLCYSREGTKHEMIQKDTWNLFLPLYAHIFTKEEAGDLIETVLLDNERFWTTFPIPSVSKRESAYTQNGFWRGPVWMATNWFVYKGLQHYGYVDLAHELKERSCTLLEHAGFREQYDPESGVGLGARDFTWGGLVIDMN